MWKKILCIISLIVILPAFSGEYEDAVARGNKIFLYMYTPNCGYCVKFNPIYEKLNTRYNSQCKFLKINAETDYGASLMTRFRASYVPYVVIVNPKKNEIKRITPQCLLNYACVNDTVGRFAEK